MPKINIFLIRHCHVAYYTEEGKRYSTPDLKNHITPLGWAQALELDFLLDQSQINFSKIYTSSLARAIETITPFALRKNISLESCDLLREVVTGSNYKEWDEATKLDPDFNFPEGESLNQVFDRFDNALNRILESNIESKESQNIIIVSHGAIMESWLSSIFKNQDIKMSWPDVYQISYENKKYFDLIHRLDLVPHNLSSHKQLNIYPKIVF